MPLRDPARVWRRRLVAALVLMLAGASTAAPVGQQPLDQSTAIDAVFNRLAGKGAQQARFHELRRLRHLDTPIESTGELVFEPPDRLEKRTLNPIRETLRLSGTQMSITINDTTRELPMDALPAAGALAGALRGLLAGRRADVEQHFQIAITLDEPDWMLQLTPGSARIEAAIRRLDVNGRGGTIRSIGIVQGNGDESQMQILSQP